MACPSENVLVDFIHRGLTLEARAQVDAHLVECEACRVIVALVVKHDPQLGAPPSTLGETARRSSAATGAGVEAELAAGERVGRYVVSRRLGAGGMGVVYAAHDPDLARPVALKMLRWRTVGDEHQAAEARARLLREAQSMARLSHPNVVAVHDVGTFGEQIFVAMEYVEGVTLTQWLRVKRTVRERLDVFRQAGLGLAAAHAAGLVHRDFKPSNVMVSVDGRVRVTDFGLARAVSPDDEREVLPLNLPVEALTHTRSGAVLGTPAYMSAEQISSEEVDHRTDQFSFCVALYEALYGERPFAGASLGELSAAITAGAIRPAPKGSDVPAWVRAAVLRGLKADRRERYPSIEALGRALDSPPVRSRSRLVLASASLVAAVVLFAAFAGWPRTQARAEAPPPPPPALTPPPEVLTAPATPAEPAPAPLAPAKPTTRGKPAAPGFVAVHISPWGTLLVDGRAAESANSMDYVVSLAGGRHQLTAAHPQFGQRTATVGVEPGKTVHWNFELR